MYKKFTSDGVQLDATRCKEPHDSLLNYRYSLLKYVPMLEFANMLNFTAMSFGNHDFDDGVEGLAPFVEGGEFQLFWKCQTTLTSSFSGNCNC